VRLRERVISPASSLPPNSCNAAAVRSLLNLQRTLDCYIYMVQCAHVTGVIGRARLEATGIGELQFDVSVTQQD
jgi:hypothetical protein